MRHTILTKKQALEEINEKAVRITGWVVIAGVLIAYLTIGTICIIHTLGELL